MPSRAATSLTLTTPCVRHAIGSPPQQLVQDGQPDFAAHALAAAGQLLPLCWLRAAGCHHHEVPIPLCSLTAPVPQAHGHKAAACQGALDVCFGQDA